MLIKGGKILDENFKFIDGEILLKEDKIEKIGKDLSDDIVIDAEGCFVVPGFIDTHMHGAVGTSYIDFEDDTIEKIGRYEASVGTTTLVPAISAAPTGKLLSVINYMKNYYKKEIEGSAQLEGIHLEGPYFSETFKGAHMPENIRNPELSEMESLIEAGEGMVKIMTIAPELPGAEEVIKYGVKNGVVMSCGHTNATFDEAQRGIGWGVGQCTHMYNAMRPLRHRDPGTVGAFLYNNDVKSELICDFFHIDPAVIKITYNVKGKDKIILITDSGIGAGYPDGEYFYHGKKIIVKNRGQYLENGTVASGTSCLLDCVKNLVSLGIPLEAACQMASKKPAETVGIYDRKGSISEGKIADLLILDKDLNLKQVILRGNLL